MTDIQTPQNTQQIEPQPQAAPALAESVADRVFGRSDDGRVLHVDFGGQDQSIGQGIDKPYDRSLEDDEDHELDRAARLAVEGAVGRAETNHRRHDNEFAKKMGAFIGKIDESRLLEDALDLDLPTNEKIPHHTRRPRHVDPVNGLTEFVKHSRRARNLGPVEKHRAPRYPK